MVYEMVICDPGFLPDWVTLLLYLIILVVIHFIIVKPILKHKKQICKRIPYLSPRLAQKLVPIIIFSIILIIMFFLYPEIASHNCPHEFWEKLGFN